MKLKLNQTITLQFSAILLLFGLTFCFAISHIFGFNWDKNYTKLFYISILTYAIIIAFKRKNEFFKLTLIDYLVLLFIAIVVFSFIGNSKQNFFSFYYIKFLPIFVFLPFLIGRLFSIDDLKNLIKIFPWLGISIFFLCCVDYLWVHNNEIVHSRYIFFGVNHSPILISFLIAIALQATLFLCLHNYLFLSTRNKLFYYFLIGIFSISLIYISSRGVLIGCQLALLIILLTSNVKKSQKIFITIYILIISSLAFQFLPKAQSDFYLRLDTVTNQMQYSKLNNDFPIEENNRINIDPLCKPLLDGVNSVAIRKVLYFEGIELFTMHPFWGVGATGFGNYSCAGIGSYPHSTLIQALSELGIIGGFLMLLLYFLSLKNFLKFYFYSKKIADIAFFYLSLFVFYFFTDQIYGNYFLMSGSFLLFGISSSLMIKVNK